VDFGAWTCKIEQFFYFALFDANALIMQVLTETKNSQIFFSSFAGI